jgi:hypothetical protein
LTVELGEDLVGGLGPGEGLAVLVPALAEPTDRGDEILYAREVATAKRLTVDDGEDLEPG